VEGGLAWLEGFFRSGQALAPAPIGLYFAKLWYGEMLYPLVFAAAALLDTSRKSLLKK